MTILHRLFSKLRSFFGQFPHPYTPSTMPFLELNIEKIKKDINLVEIGRKRGERNEPPADSTSLDDIEQKIVTTIENEKKKSYQIYIDNLKTYADRLRSLDFETRISSIEQSARNAISEFRTKVHNGRDQLYQLRKNVIEFGREEEDFRKKHSLNRTANFPDSKVLHIGVILVLLLVESLLNGNFLARGSELGLIGGVLDALVISIVNVGLGFLVGTYVVRQMFHFKMGHKTAGWIGTLIFIFISFVFNIGVAHYRDALGGELPEKAASLALKSFLKAPFDIADLKSWMMVLVGFSFSIVAAIDAFRMDDPYPGYGPIAKKHVNIVQEYADGKEELIEDLRETKDIASESMMQAKKDVEKRKHEYYSAIDARGRMERFFQAHLEHLESCVNTLLTEYREANRQTRRADTPSRFSELWRLEQLPADDIGNIGKITSDELEKKVKRAISSLMRHVKEVFTEYEKAVEKYKLIEQLTIEDL